jgi:hypothetical protein
VEIFSQTIKASSNSAKALECLGRGRKFVELILDLGTAASEVSLLYFFVLSPADLVLSTMIDTPCSESGDGGNKCPL